MKTKFFDDIERLRGFACILVLIQHIAWICPLRFIYEIVPQKLLIGSGGVNIFFAISGFVVTLSIKNQLSSLRGNTFLEKMLSAGEFLRSFYKRRFFRIFPTVFFVVILAGVYLNFSEDNLKWLPALLRAPAEIFFGVYNNSVELFVSSERIHTSGLGPFWTLAVEMQFYIFWPLILLLCKNDNIRAIVSLFLGCLFLLMVRPIANEFWGAKYYLIHNNLSELFLGSFLAFLYDGSASAMTPQTSKLISIILAILIWFYPNSINNTFFSGTVVSLSSVFIVGLAVFARESFDIPLLGKIFGFLGRRSFSFYAVQLVLANIVVWYVNSIYFSQKSLSEYEFYFYQFIIFIIMLFTVSELVYRFIEKPSREFGRR